MSRLLILGCSDRKVRFPEAPIPALQRYDGVFYRVLRRNITEPPPELLILSAEFGLIRHNTAIPFYDSRMTRERAAELRPQVQSMLLPLLTSGFNDIFINLGKTYLLALGDVMTAHHAVFARGGIGQRAAQMKGWLLR